MENKYVSYYRVSTDAQGRSGLGLKGQSDYLTKFIQENGVLVDSFTDVETGKSDSRSGLLGAIDSCRSNGAILLAYDITRISRGGYSMMAKLEKSEIPFISATNPNDSDFSIALKFAIAKEEADRISKNTKKALQVIKDKLDRGEEHISKSGRIIVSLGTPDPVSRLAIENSARNRRASAISNVDNKKAGAFIIALRDGGSSFYSITVTLNKVGFKTSKGNDFSQVQTKRLYERYV